MPLRHVILSGDASRDLLRIRQWGTEQFGATVAAGYTRHLSDLVRRIRRDPDDWASKPEPLWGTDVRSMSMRVVFSRGRHRAIYRLHPHTIEVLRLIHLAASDLPLREASRRK